MQHKYQRNDFMVCIYTYEKYFRMGKIEHPKTIINELKIIFKLYHVYIIVKFLHTINIKNRGFLNHIIKNRIKISRTFSLC